ncbi:hypothetical protein C8R46DRAFT_917095, partial [Mycena filopes]
HIPRPRNAFILFRCNYLKIKQRVSRHRDSVGQSVISKGASEVWRKMDEGEREPYFILAREEKAAHTLRYPHYQYHPGRPRAAKVTSRKQQKVRQGSCIIANKLEGIPSGTNAAVVSPQKGSSVS